MIGDQLLLIFFPFFSDFFLLFCILLNDSILLAPYNLCENVAYLYTIHLLLHPIRIYITLIWVCNGVMPICTT